MNPNLAEQIREKCERLPPALQREALDFVEFLLAKSATLDRRNEDQTWSLFSLLSAMRGMEDEDTSDYENVIYKEKWR